MHDDSNRGLARSTPNRRESRNVRNTGSRRDIKSSIGTATPAAETLATTGTPVPKFIDPVFVKTSPKCAFSMTENEHFRLVFVKLGL
jgi:hypothetical protein